MTHSTNFAFVYIFDHVSRTRVSYCVTGELTFHNSRFTITSSKLEISIYISINLSVLGKVCTELLFSCTDSLIKFFKICYIHLFEHSTLIKKVSLDSRGPSSRKVELISERPCEQLRRSRCSHENASVRHTRSGT